MSKNYDKQVVISKLRRRRFRFKPNLSNPVYIEVSKRIGIGIKTWGMIDFLGLNVVRTGK